MNVQETLESSLAHLKPMLDAAGRAIEVKEATDTSCTIVLKGFCGDCACSGSYMEGIEEILAEQAPQVKEIKFIQV